MTGRGGGDGLVLTQAGPLHSHWLATGRVTGRHPRCINWKCLRFWDTPTWNNSTDTKYSWMPHTYLTGWIVISLSSSLNYHPSVSVHDIQQKGLKLVFMLLLIPTDNRVAKAMLFLACMREGCATFRSPITSSGVTWITWSPLSRSLSNVFLCHAQLI